MSCKTRKYCLPSTLLLLGMLMFQVATAQYDFTGTEKWLKDNLNELGGRAVLLVFKDGKLLYSKAENDLSRRQQFMGKIIARKTGKPADEVLKDFNKDSRIPIASCSKWLSAALIMTFVDEGKIALNDSIGKFLPVMTANGKGNITIAQSLSHLTGIRSGNLKESREMTSNAESMDDAIANIAKQPMEATPGSSFHYSSTGLQIVAAIAEKISGRSFESLFEERIAKPCGMIGTDFGHKKVPLAAGGAFSTASDYLNFLEMILNNGVYNGSRVLKSTSVSLMQTNYTSGKQVAYSPSEAGNWGYGFGEWIMDNASLNTRSSAVSSPGLFGSFPWVDNKLQYAAVLFTFNLNHKGRNEKYTALKRSIDNVLTKK